MISKLNGSSIVIELLQCEPSSSELNATCALYLAKARVLLWKIQTQTSLKANGKVSWERELDKTILELRCAIVLRSEPLIWHIFHSLLFKKLNMSHSLKQRQPSIYMIVPSAYQRATSWSATRLRAYLSSRLVAPPPPQKPIVTLPRVWLKPQPRKYYASDSSYGGRLYLHLWWRWLREWRTSRLCSRRKLPLHALILWRRADPQLDGH